MKFAVLVASGLMLMLIPPVSAANSTMSSLVTQILAKKLEADAAARPEPFATVNRSGTLKLTGVVDNASRFKGPITATVIFEGVGSSANLFFETSATTVRFKGRLGKFTVRMPFHWQGTDQNGEIAYVVILTSGSCESATLIAGAGESSDICRRVTEFVSFDPLPMPTQDGVTTAVSVTMVQ